MGLEDKRHAYQRLSVPFKNTPEKDSGVFRSTNLPSI